MDEPTAQRLASIEAELKALRALFERLAPVLDLIEPLVPMARSKLGRTAALAVLTRGSKS